MAPKYRGCAARVRGTLALACEVVGECRRLPVTPRGAGPERRERNRDKKSRPLGAGKLFSIVLLLHHGFLI